MRSPKKTLKTTRRRTPIRAATYALAALASLAGTCITAHAVGVRPNAIRNHGLFGITVAGTAQEFYGKADLVLSVSLQEYTTGPLFVTEVVIDLMGSNQLLRLYATRPAGVSDVAAAAGNAAAASHELTNGAISPTVPEVPSEVARADATAQRAYARSLGATVVKTYPATTHAKTVEFNVASRAELVAFYTTFKNLYTNQDVRIANGKVVAKIAAADGSATGATVISKLGGVHFTIE